VVEDWAANPVVFCGGGLGCKFKGQWFDPDRGSKNILYDDCKCKYRKAREFCCTLYLIIANQ